MKKLTKILLAFCSIFTILTTTALTINNKQIETVNAEENIDWTELPYLGDFTFKADYQTLDSQGTEQLNLITKNDYLDQLTIFNVTEVYINNNIVFTNYNPNHFTSLIIRLIDTNKFTITTTNENTNTQILFYSQPTSLTANDEIKLFGYIEQSGNIENRSLFFLKYSSWDIQSIQVDQITEAIDMRSLIFEILSMPFNFILNAFDLTLWPGTDYEINFSIIILAIIGILTAILIIKIIKKVKP